MAEQPDKVWIWTDGGCSPNPGPGGWGVVMTWRNHRRDACGHAPSTTNNRMELTAVVRALAMLNRPMSVRIHSDSKYVVNGAGWMAGWKRRGWKTVGGGNVKNVDLWQELDAAIAIHAVEWVWTKGHADDPYNKIADKLASQGVRGKSINKRTQVSSTDAPEVGSRRASKPGQTKRLRQPKAAKRRNANRRAVRGF